MPSMLSRIASGHHGKQHRHTKSPFTNNDEPTPRIAPSDDDGRESRMSLREEAARGAGTPGYLVKQPQDRVSSALDPHHIDRLDSGSTSASASSSSHSPGAGKGVLADEATASNSPLRGELEEAPKPADASAEGQRPDSPSQRPPSPTSGRSQHSALGSPPPKPSEHEQGVWQGFLNIFRFEKKRASITGLPSEALGIGGPSLGEAHALPGPHDVDLSINIPGTDQDSLLKNKLLTEGKRSSRSNSILSPRGTLPTTAGGVETADEERMRTYLNLEAADESDFVSSARKGSSLSLLPDGSSEQGAPASALKGATSGESRKSATVQLPAASSSSNRGSSSSGGTSAAAEARRKHEAEEAKRMSASGSSSSDRRSVGSSPSPPVPEGEAVMMRKSRDSHEGGGEVGRGSAQERVFGDRRKSKINVTQLRGGDVDEGEGGSPSKIDASDEREAAAQLEAAKKLHAAKLREWDAKNAHWMQQGAASSVPKSYDGVRFSKMPPAKEDIEKLISSLTRPVRAPLPRTATATSLTVWPTVTAPPPRTCVLTFSLPPLTPPLAPPSRHGVVFSRRSRACCISATCTICSSRSYDCGSARRRGMSARPRAPSSTWRSHPRGRGC